MGQAVSPSLRSAGTPTNLASVTAALGRWAARAPERTAYVFLADGEEEQDRLTYAALDTRARAIAAALGRAVMPGERVLLLYPPGLDFIAAFFGCLYAGLIAVPAYPPRSPRMMPRLLSLLADARPAVALASGASLTRVRGWLERTPEAAALSWLATDGLEPAPAGWEPAAPESDDIAFLQYTSGSTSTPKGVMVSHGNLLHNQEMIRRAFGQDEDSVIVGWLPLYHDMGLIGNVLQPLYVGARCVLMSPHSFLQRPQRWLEAISRHGATTSGGPNFAYDLCARKVSPADLAGLDLSRWNVAFNGAEPVRPETLERFATTFAPAGFRREAFYPCYGLAEGTLFAAGGLCGRAPEVRAFEASALEQNRAVPVEAGPAPARRLVGCGHAWMEQEIAVVDPETGERCASGQVGEIWISGPSVARGYWGRAEETQRTFGAELPGSGRPFLRTGDLGVISEGELFVTGRLKDLIILRGRNLYPQDIELTVEASHPALRAGCAAAFPVEVAGEERLVVVQEIERRQQDHVDVEAVAEAIRRAVAEEHEARVHEVVLLEAGAIPKTSSGKIQRHACRAGYLAGSLALVGRSTAPGPTFGEEGAPALDRGALLALPPEDRQAAVEAFLTGRIARLTGLGGAPGELAAGRSLASLGLDSLMVVELRNALAAGLGIEIPMTALFQDSGGIAELAGAVLAGLHGTAEEDTAEAPAPGRERPLTWGQKGLWLLDRMAPDCGVCNVGGAARVRSPLDSGALRRALVRLARRHPALRTVFGSRGEEPWQRVEADLAPGFAVRDASGWSSAELEERLLAEIYRPFDLAHGPLIRAAVWTLAPGEAVLSLSVHHLIADLWSLVVVLRDLGALYEEESGGAAAELPRLALSPADGFRRQERALSGERGERLRSYWSEKLAGPLPVVELPADRLRPPVPSHAGSSVGFRVPGGVADRLRELARQGDATLYTVLLGAFLALIHRQTGQEDLVIGSPTSGRTIPGCEPLVGYLVNPVALRAGVDGDAPFAALLSRVREAVLGALDHQEYPFTLLAERREGPRDASRSPIFQLAFVFQKPHLPELAGLGAFALGEGGGEVRCGGLRLESIGLPQARVQFDLTLVIAEREAGLGAAFQYATDLFDGATGARLASQMGILLEGIAAGPHLAIGDLPLLSATEERQLLVEWNRTGVDGPRGLCLHELFEAQVERTPEAVAVICGEERLSYLELEERANRLAHHLRSMGVGPEARVGVCMERSAELIAALLGVLKAGGAYVPLDPAYPGERIAFMVEDSGARPVLTRELLEREREALAAASAERPRRAALPEHLAYVIYTSGSTGRPKGVAIEHAAPVELALWARGLFGPEALSRVLASTSVCFDLSVFEIFVPLCWGGAVVLVDNALGLPAAPAAGEVTLINTVPSVLTELLRMGALPASAATVNLAGEPLPRALARQAYAVPSVRRLFNLYGPSEDTTYSTFALVGAEEPGAPAIGRPIANTRAHVLDRRLRPVPVGVPGELYLGGRGLARGYQGRPELTAERFIPDPFASLAGEPGARLYKTGDRVRRMPDGALDFQGRLDHQVKVRGVRIELGEVEAALCEHPGVRQAAAAVGRDGLLAAYLVPRSGGGLAWPELREALRRRLPEALVPSLAMVLDALPLTPGGKVDRKALPEPEMAARRERTAPRTPLEERLAAIWSDLLGVGEIGIEESFFDLGGHSLLALRVISRVREELGVELALRTVFERPTVAALAAALEEPGVDGKGAAPPAPPLRPVPRDGGLPLSFAQERLWFLHELMPESVAYNIPAALRLSGRLDPGALRRTFEEIALRQESLRTTFRLADGRPVQWITPAGPWPLPVVDLAALGPEEREREARHRAAEEAALPFDLAAGPLVRTMLLRLSPEEHILALTAHHAVFDGWSLGILSREMGGLYPVLAQGGDGRGLLPGLSVQYADFAVWQRRWLADGELDRQLAWWRQRLAGAPALLELPADRPRPKTATGRGGTRSSRLAPDLTAALHTLGRGRGATLFMTLFAGWAALLNRYTGEADLVVGTPVANRPRAVLEDLIGLFVNSLPLRTDLDGDPAFPELLDRVREGLLGAQAHQDLPFEKLVEALAPRRSTAHTPLFQVLFVLQNAPFTALELPGLILSPVEIEGRTAQLDLSLSLAESGPEIAATLEFNRDLFDASTADRLLGHLEILLAGAVDAPQRPLTDLPLLTAAERRQLEAEAGGAGGAPPGESRLDRLFDEQAARTPEAVALVCDDMALTYAELRERSDRLARHLAGIAPEAPLGVCLESSPELVVSLLAVWKAGGAYLPLDPAYPPERLAFMVEDAGVPAVLTSGQRPVLPWAGDARVVVVTGGGPAGELPPSRGHASPGTLAWIIYTSGSTGRPKGVAVEHGAAADHLRNVVAAWGLGGGDRVLQLSSPSFDMSLEEIVAPLLCGATVVLRGTDPWEPSRLLDRADALGLTVLNLPTAYWQQWIRECEQGGAAGRLPLRLVVVGGEAVPAEAARRWRRTPLGGVRLLNGYGPTEAVISASFHAADAAEAAPDGSVPIGRPLPGRSGWVLDRRGAPLPPGVPGELHLGGRALARGYPGRPGLTAERFVPDPFSAVPGSRLYRTGDLVRRLPAGPLSFLGRIDRQVKVRGFRIEPGEVEAALRAHPAVRDAAVVVRGEGEARILAAFVVPAAVPLQELRAFLRGRLPEHLVPSRFEALDALPLTPAGKVDRAALARRHPEPEARAGAAEPGRPPTPVEEVLAGIWAEVLGRGQVGLEEDFFELGGHSLLATQVASRLRACFGVELPLQTLFAAPTVARLAAAVEAALRCAAGMAASEPPLVPAAPALRSQGLPLSFAQERLWFLDRLEPESPVYNISAAVLLEGDLQGEALRQALEWIVARHEALRTTFREVDGRPVQVAAPALAVLLPAVDLGGLPETDRGEEVLRLTEEEALRPFDLEAGPLLRAVLVRCARGEHRLLLTLHHIISDGWSLGVLVREVNAAYGAAVEARRPQLPALPVQYADYAVWQRSWLTGEALAAHLSWWRE
ncbi:MAG TPA: amino acid adenylation domain-containing protein, partial [Thermoanaerobaculia bacterium]|nr:amino acid adenylation domain-containing protein [Thermoanaerobaculia bacterium]